MFCGLVWIGVDLGVPSIDSKALDALSLHNGYYVTDFCYSLFIYVYNCVSMYNSFSSPLDS